MLVVVVLAVLAVAIAAGAGLALRGSGSEHDGDSAEAIAAETDGGSGEADADATAEETDGDRVDSEEGDEGELFEDPGGYWLAQREAAGQEITTFQLRRAQEQAAAVTPSEGTWTDLGPTNIGGRITDLVVDPSSPNTIYIAAA